MEGAACCEEHRLHGAPEEGLTWFRDRCSLPSEKFRISLSVGPMEPLLLDVCVIR